MALAITAWKCLPLSGLTADTSVSQIFSSLFIPLAWLRIWIMFVYYVVFLIPNGIFLIHENTCLVLFINSCTKCFERQKQTKNCEMRSKIKMPLCITYLIFQRFTKLFFQCEHLHFVLFFSWIWQFSLWLHFPSVEVYCFFV